MSGFYLELTFKTIQIMNTLVTISIIVAAIIIVALIIKFFTGRNKRHADKTSGEKLASQVATSVSSTINRMIEGARTPEAIKEELLEKVKATKDRLKEEFRNYLTELLTTIETHKKLVSNNETRIQELKKKAKEYKTQYINSNDSKYKNYANRIIAQLISIEKLVESSKQVITSCTNKKEEAEINYDLLVGELETKHAEIIAMTMNPELSFNLSTIDIADLTVEFKEKISQRTIQTEVSNIVNKSTSNVVPEISSSELDEYFEQL
jgi:FtsZ-interacting cell division protein ZipA